MRPTFFKDAFFSRWSGLFRNNNRMMTYIYANNKYIKAVMRNMNVHYSGDVNVAFEFIL